MPRIGPPIPVDNIYLVKTADDLPDIKSQWRLYNLLFDPGAGIGVYYSQDGISLLRLDAGGVPTTLAGLTDTDLTGQAQFDLLYNVDGANWHDTGGVLQWSGTQLTINDYTFPAADGSADQILQTDGLGVISFADFTPTYFELSAINRVIGSNAGDSQSGNNVFLSLLNAGQFNTADGVIAIGTEALGVAADVDFANSIVIGHNAMPLTTNTRDPWLAIGANILAVHTGATFHDANTMIGHNVLLSKTGSGSIQANTIIGFDAVRDMTTASISSSVVIGSDAGRGAATANIASSILIGRDAAGDMGVGGVSSCVVIGSGAGENLDGALRTTIVGVSTIPNAGDVDESVIIGYGSLGFSGGTGNLISIGSQVRGGGGALGDANILIGSFITTVGLNTFDHCIIIGHGAGNDLVSDNDVFAIEQPQGGGSGLVRPYLFGNMEAGNLALLNIAAMVGGSESAARILPSWADAVPTLGQGVFSMYGAGTDLAATTDTDFVHMYVRSADNCFVFRFEGGDEFVLCNDGTGPTIPGLVFDLQDAYDVTPAAPQIIASSGNPVSFRAFADPDTIFQLQRNDAGQVFLVESLATGYEFTLGPVGNRSWVLSEPSTISNPTTAQIIPDGRTKTVINAVDNSSVLYWDSTFISNIAGGGGIGNDSGFGMVFSVGTLELLDQGNLFSTSILFNQATRVEIGAANTGPLYTMVNQPQLRNAGATNRTGSQANAVRSQMRIQPDSTGDITLASHETYFATIILDSSVSTGDAFCTTVNYFAAKAPGFLGVGGAITTLHCLDLPDIPIAGITTLHGISSAMSAGFFINHSGVAPSTFNGDIEITDSTLLQLGTTSGGEFSRISSSGIRLQGFGGANNEGIDFGLQNVNFVQMTPVSGGLGFKMNSLEFAFGSGADPDGTNNWVMIFAPGLRGTSLAGDYSEVLFSSASAIAVAHAISNFATWTVNAPTISIAGGSIVNAANVLIQTSMSEGTNRYGLLVTSNPSGGTLNYAARFTGATGVRIDGLFEHTGTLVGLYGTTPAVQSPAYTPTNVSTDRAFDANATTVDELADVLGTLIADLQSRGFVG